VSDNNINAGPDPSTTVNEASAWLQTFLAFTSTQNVSAFLAEHQAVAAALTHIKTPSMVAKIAGTILSMLAELAAGALNGLGDIKDGAGGGFRDLISAAINDLTGANVELTGGDSSDAGNTKAQDNAAAGAAIFDVLTQMFGGFGNISPDQGAANAKAFLGFGVNFAVVTAFLGIIGGLVPILRVEELKGIGEEVAHALGLGRLTHTAVTPLVRNMIAQPFDLWLRAQLRPDRLAEAQLVRALRSGNMDEATVRQQLAEKGYPDDAIDFLLTDLEERLALGELMTLLLNSDLSEQDVINNLTLLGMPEDQANLRLKAAREQTAKSQQDSLLSALGTSYINGFIDEGTYSAMLDKLPISDEQDQAFRQRIGFEQETPRKRVAFSDVKNAIVANIVDFTYLDTWLAAEGYDPQSNLILNYEVIEAMKTATDKETAKKYKAAQLVKAGKPVPPWLQG